MQEIKINESKSIRVEKKEYPEKSGQIVFGISEFNSYEGRYVKNISFAFSEEKVNKLIEAINIESFSAEFKPASELTSEEKISKAEETDEFVQKELSE